MPANIELVFRLTCVADKDYSKTWNEIPVEKRESLGLYGQLPCDGSLKMGQYCWNCQLCSREWVKSGT